MPKKIKPIKRTPENILEETLKAAQATLEIIVHNLEWYKEQKNKS